jgi:DNA-binding HxlR family transcriptional regulator
MRRYNQYCPIARSLDVIGDRWTLLVIRELRSRDSRYSDLRDALPGIATNLLADRLRQLEADGLIESYEAPVPVRASVYRLTPRGHQLSPVLRALVEWGGPLLATGQRSDTFRTHWLALELPALFAGVDVGDLAPLTILVRTGDRPATIELNDVGFAMSVGVAASSEQDVVVEGNPEDVFALLTGTGAARNRAGASVRGPRDAVRRLHALAARSRLANPPAAEYYAR